MIDNNTYDDWQQHLWWLKTTLMMTNNNMYEDWQQHLRWLTTTFLMIDNNTYEDWQQHVWGLKTTPLMTKCCHLPTQRVPRRRMTTRRTSLDVFGEHSRRTSGRIPPNFTILFWFSTSVRPSAFMPIQPATDTYSNTYPTTRTAHPQNARPVHLVP